MTYGNNEPGEYSPHPGNYPPPTNTKNRKVWPWILGAFLIALICVGGPIVACTVVAGGTVAAIEEVDKEIKKSEALKTKQVKIDECKRDSFGFVTVAFTVKNDSDTVQSYWIQFEVKNSEGIRVGEAHGVINDLAFGDTAKDNSVSAAEVGAKKFTCSVVKVN